MTFFAYHLPLFFFLFLFCPPYAHFRTPPLPPLLLQKNSEIKKQNKPHEGRRRKTIKERQKSREQAKERARALLEKGPHRESEREKKSREER